VSSLGFAPPDGEVASHRCPRRLKSPSRASRAYWESPFSDDADSITLSDGDAEVALPRVVLHGLVGQFRRKWLNSLHPKQRPLARGFFGPLRTDSAAEISMEVGPSDFLDGPACPCTERTQ